MKRIILLIALIGIGVGSFAQNSTLAKGKKVNIPMSEAAMIPGASATSGTLTVGLTYVIGVFETGDDFANVGAGSNATGVEFIATGTTPTDWSNGSLLSALNQSTKDLADNSTITANNVYPTQGVRGNGQKWFKFDGTDDYVNIADAAAFDFGTLDFTLHATFTPDNVTDQNKYIVNKEAGGVGYGLQQYEDDIKIRFDDNTTDVSAIIATGVLTADTEVVVFVTFDRSGNATCYVDGVASGTVAISTANLTLSNAGALRIGTETGGTTNAFNGDISWVGEYNYMPSADSITSWSTKIAEGTFHLPAVDQGATNTVLTSGTLETGKVYLIIDWITNDDFTNIGGTNADGTVFTATGTTPTTWTNSSTVVELGSTLSLSPEGIYSTAWNDYYHLESYAVSGPTREEYGKHTALRLNGSDSYLMKADADFDGTGGMVIAGWMNPASWGEGDSGASGYLLSDSKLLLTLRETNENMRLTRNGFTNEARSSPSSIELNKWIFFAITTASDGTTYFYLGDKNTSPVFSESSDYDGGTPEDGDNLFVGNFTSAASKTFNGPLDFNIWYLDQINMPISEWITLLYESTK